MEEVSEVMQEIRSIGGQRVSRRADMEEVRGFVGGSQRIQTTLPQSMFSLPGYPLSLQHTVHRGREDVSGGKLPMT